MRKPLQLFAVPSHAQFVILDPEENLVSEHPSAEEATKALIVVLAPHPSENYSIYQRLKEQWVEF